MRQTRTISRIINWLAQVIRWILKEWFFVLIPLMLASIHIYLLRKFNFPIDGSVNKFIFVSLQIVGFWIILSSIDSNLKAFNKGTLNSEISKRFKRFPKFKPILEFHATLSPQVDFIAEIRTLPHFRNEIFNSSTTEDKVEKLIRAVRALEYNDKIFSREIDFIRQEAIPGIHKKYSGIENLLKNTESRVEDLATGGWEWEIFGFLLAMYSSIVDLLSSL